MLHCGLRLLPCTSTTLCQSLHASLHLCPFAYNPSNCPRLCVPEICMRIASSSQTAQSLFPPFPNSQTHTTRARHIYPPSPPLPPQNHPKTSQSTLIKPKTVHLTHLLSAHATTPSSRPLPIPDQRSLRMYLFTSSTILTSVLSNCNPIQ